ncbi:MAG: hypothetical protein NW214_04930 [Pseudanabaenaceae cyanobacterium bins.39]|nr:hypothetical protein [Pseudanabaenaceae cyanobacterium bins.39]
MNKDSDWMDLNDLNAELHEVKDALANLEHRLHQVQQAAIAKSELLKQQQQINQQLKESKIRRKPNAADRSSQVSDQQTYKQELQVISDRLEQIESELESRLISGSSLRETFWQIVRFGGLGIVIGLILRSCAG